MKILLMNQFFWPDEAATSQLLTDVARALASRGHDVSVVCGEASYGVRAASAEVPPPVRIHRIKSIAFARNSVGRLLSYASYFGGCLLHGLTAKRPDVVVSLTTPPLLSLVGTLIHKLRRSRHFIWEMDVYPEVAVGLNYFQRGGLLERVIGTLADWSRRDANGILALGPCMRDLLVHRGMDAQKISVVENWADGAGFETDRPGGQNSDDETPLSVLYSGNLGLAHDADTILQAMRDLKGDSRFRFIFAGAGGRRKRLEEICRAEKLEASEFRPYAQRSDLGQSLSTGDIGLVTQLPAALGSVVPSKVYGLMAAARPILFIGPPEATPARIIRAFNCGWQVNCSDSAALVGLLRHLAEHREEVRAAGLRARTVFLQHYDLPIGVARVCDVITRGERGEAFAGVNRPAVVSTNQAIRDESLALSASDH